MSMMFYGSKDDQLKGLMKSPDRVEKFGPGAYVYSEIAARAMVIAAYAEGEKAAKQQPQ